MISASLARCPSGRRSPGSSPCSRRQRTRRPGTSRMSSSMRVRLAANASTCCRAASCRLRCWAVPTAATRRVRSSRARGRRPRDSVPRCADRDARPIRHPRISGTSSSRERHTRRRNSSTGRRSPPASPLRFQRQEADVAPCRSSRSSRTAPASGNGVTTALTPRRRASSSREIGRRPGDRARLGIDAALHRIGRDERRSQVPVGATTLPWACSAKHESEQGNEKMHHMPPERSRSKGDSLVEDRIEDVTCVE